MSDIHVGDFVEHKDAKHMIFQVVQILRPVTENDPPMINCIRVTDVRAYLETDLRKHELTRTDCENITNHSL